MKKTILFAAALALTLASCGNKTQNAGNATDSTEVAIDDENLDEAPALSAETQSKVEELSVALTKAIDAKDSKAISETLTALQTTYKQLVESGNVEEAKSYGAAIKQLVSEKADGIKQAASGDVSAIEQLVNGVKNLPTSAEATAEDVKNAAASTATSAVNDAKDKANEKVNETKEAAKAKANEAVNEAKTKATDKVNETKEAAKAKTNEAVNKAADKALKGLGL